MDIIFYTRGIRWTSIMMLIIQSYMMESYVPRIGSSYGKYNRNTPALLMNLYESHGDRFVNYIKGNFVIIVLKGTVFEVYSDHFGIRKYYSRIEKEKFIISNDIANIIKHKSANLSTIDLAIYGLMLHNIGGRTAFI